MNAVIIVAGGKGLRMGAALPKQFLPIGGKPVLLRTIERFRAFDPALSIVVVLPEAQQDYWRTLCDDPSLLIANGGETRFHSVRNGLALVPQDAELIAVHDGVRPFVSVETIRRTFDEAAKKGAAIPVVDVVETVRHLDGQGGSQTVPRADYKLVQTPQVFRADLLRRAYAQPFREQFTDDASVVESLPHPVALVEGNRENIKLTTPYDLKIAEHLYAEL